MGGRLSEAIGQLASLVSWFFVFLVWLASGVWRLLVWLASGVWRLASIC
jgi:hypothetical protein